MQRLLFDWFDKENPTPPLEYFCYAWTCSFTGQTEADFWNSTTDHVFSALVFAELEHAAERQLRFMRMP